MQSFPGLFCRFFVDENKGLTLLYHLSHYSWEGKGRLGGMKKDSQGSAEIRVSEAATLLPVNVDASTSLQAFRKQVLPVYAKAATALILE